MEGVDGHDKQSSTASMPLRTFKQVTQPGRIHPATDWSTVNQSGMRIGLTGI